MEQVTTVEKSRNGWRAETAVNLENRVLKVQTRANTGGGIATWASVHNVEGNGLLSHVLMKDYSTAVKVNLVARCTEKAIRSQHAEILLNLEKVKESVTLFYQAPAANAGNWKTVIAPLSESSVGV